MDSQHEQPATPSTLDAGTESPHPSVEVEQTAPEPAAAEVPARATPKPSAIRRVFVGPFGLRAGWSVLIYLALIFLLVSAVRFGHDAVTHQHHFAPKVKAGMAVKPAPAAPKADPNKPQPMKGMILSESIVFALVLFVSWIMARIERRRFAVFGLGGTRSLARFLAGGFWGLVVMGLFIGILHGFGFLHFDQLLDHGVYILVFGGLQLIAFLLVGVFEEYLFRGYIQFTLTRGLVSVGNLISRTHARAIGFWLASVITSAIFLYAHTHNSGETKFGLFTVFLAGLLFVIALWRTGSLWWAIGFHTTWDWSQSFLYGVPDSGGLMQGRLFATHASGNPLLSGGTVGPEGSVVVAIPLTLAILVLLFLTRPSPQPPLELSTKNAGAMEPVPEPEGMQPEAI